MTTLDHAALQFHSGLRFCSIRVRLIGFEPEMYETFDRKICKSCGGKSNYEPWRITIIKLSMYMLPTKPLNCSVTVLTFSFETKDSRTRSFDRNNCGTCMRAHLSTFQQPSSSQEQRKTNNNGTSSQVSSYINDSLHLVRKYARIYVRGHYLFREANSFPRA